MKKNTKAALRTLPYTLAFVITVLLVAHLIVGLHYFAYGIPKFGYLFLLVLALVGLGVVVYVARREYKRNSK